MKHLGGSLRLGLLILFVSACSSAPSPELTTPGPTGHHEEHPPVDPLTPAPMIEAITGSGICEEESCTGVEPKTASILQSQTLPNRRTRGSNSQMALPRNIVLADINADGYTDFLQYSSNKIFVSKTDFNKTGLLHHYTPRPIKRLITGDFHGDRYDQVCAILDTNALRCYGLSTDKTELWWWFTQGSFIADNEDFIVGDFDGDRRDDILVYPRSGGAFRMYSQKGSFFFRATPSFNQGNLRGVNQSGLQVRAGDFNADGRDDLMIVNRWGQILYYASVNDRGTQTFWWAFTTVGNFVSRDEQVSVARIDNDARDDIVIHNRKTGATRFHAMSYNHGRPPSVGISKGQINTSPDSLLVWGVMGGATEPGGYYRDDAMVYLQRYNMFVRSDARYDSRNRRYTYWWAYTQHAPNNHQGWASFEQKPWLILKCQFSDNATVPQANQFYWDLNNTHTNYWRDLSYGSWDLSGSRVIDAWQRMSVNNADWRNLSSRWNRAGACINAYGRSTSGFVNVVSIVNAEGDAGNAGGRVLMTPNSSNATFMAHETGHTFGWGHSFDDTDRKNASWSSPGEYFDTWDIMSAMAVYTFAHPQGVVAGPDMNAIYKTRQSFIPNHRILRLSGSELSRNRQIDIAALNRPEANGPLLVRLGSNNNDFYTLEYRMKSGWDQGIPRHTVLVHRVRNGVSYLITAGGTERLPGSSTSISVDGRNLTVSVDSFASQGFTARITLN